jgi:hypothetical protein
LSDIEIIDHGLGRYQSQMDYLTSHYLKVGLPANEAVGSAQRQGSHAPFGTMDELVEIMTVHEFGSSNAGIPQRSFLRSAVDDNRTRIEALQEELLDQMVIGQINAVTALDRLGVFVTGLVRDKIRTISTPPNTPETIRRKGSSNPLIDTGQARQSIQFVKKRIGTP